MQVNLPYGLATIEVDDDGTITLSTPIDGEPPSGMMTITYSPSVTVAFIESTISMLQQIALQMPAS